MCTNNQVQAVSWVRLCTVTHARTHTHTHTHMHAQKSCTIYCTCNEIETYNERIYIIYRQILLSVVKLTTEHVVSQQSLLVLL